MHGETEARWASLVGDMLCTVSHGITMSGKCCLSNPRGVSIPHSRTRNPEHNSFAEFWVLLAQY